MIYKTKDTGEALALMVCGHEVVSHEKYRNIHGSLTTFFVFDDGPEREAISDAYFEQAHFIDIPLELSPTDIARAVCVANLLRKNLFARINQD